MGDPIKQDEGQAKGKPKVKPVGNPEQSALDNNIRAVLLFAFFSAAVRLLAMAVQRRHPA